MIEFSPDSQPGLRAQFDQFRTAVQRQCTDVRFAWIGGNLLIVGTVPTYALKASIEADATQAGLPFQNCVRVVPGRSVEGFRMTG